METTYSDQLSIIISQLQKLKTQVPSKQNLHSLFQLMSIYIESKTKKERITFTTLFSRISFLSSQGIIKGELLKKVHLFRMANEKGGLADNEIELLYGYGISVLSQLLEGVEGLALPFKNADMPFPFDLKKNTVSGFYRVIKGIVLNSDSDIEKGIMFYSEDQPFDLKKIYLKDEDQIRKYNRVLKYIQPPFATSFIDVKKEKERFEASSFVILPDYLVGVTSISECFQYNGFTPLIYLARKLMPIDSSIYMLIGNVVNFFLDELIHDSSLTFKSMFLKVFQLAPMSFALMSDKELKDVLIKLEVHFENLKNTVNQDLIEVNIAKEDSYLEPSFYSSEYGIQGRLDLYHFNKRDNQSDIVELKSGKLFKANKYNLNSNHYVQTLIYDLLMESVHQGRVKSSNYILYSSLDKNALKYAPRLRSKQLDALSLRNDIVLIEHILSNDMNEMFDKLIDNLNPEKISKEFNFLQRDANRFYNIYKNANPLVKAYYKSFIAFVNREFLFSKIGEHGVFENNGLASLWLDSIDEKIDGFRILSYLQIIDNQSDSDQPYITLEYTKLSTKLSRFRVGDIAVLYPDDGYEKSALRVQLFKCTIVELSNKSIKIKLRARQKNADIFDSFSNWHLESDVLDGSFNSQVKDLFSFLSSSPKYQQLILGLKAPQKSDIKRYYSHDELTVEQMKILNAAISAEEYYLLWGPPGTGKTSIMIKHMVAHYFTNTSYNVLLLAYTNRAVDEICSSVEKICDENYIRIGSRYSTQDRYKDRLLSVFSENVKKRRDLQSKIENTRIFVSTVSSFRGKKDLMKLKKFDIVIIDEASQLLEPMIVGLLSNFSKFIMIGDHKQLPAVVTQNEETSYALNGLLLEETEIYDMRISLFERMFKTCKKNNWSWAFGGLKHQGRMHRDILSFISPQFYESQLEILKNLNRLVDKPSLHFNSNLTDIFVNKRMIFIDVPADSNVVNKTNKLEAELVIKIVKIYKEIYHYSKKELSANDIGLITPFRSQIALIGELMNSEYDNLVTLDTIERYQGSSRNQIVISLAVSKSQLLDSIGNESTEGIDRKLNVALTRAKENIVILGAKKILEAKPVYKHLIEYCYNLDYKLILDYNKQL